MPLRTVHVKVKSGNQKIAERDLVLDPDDDLQVQEALRATLGQLGEDPKPYHRIQLFKPTGEWIRELHAA